jgi:hypothetical protein
MTRLVRALAIGALLLSPAAAGARTGWAWAWAWAWGASASSSASAGDNPRAGSVRGTVVSVGGLGKARRACRGV